MLNCFLRVNGTFSNQEKGTFGVSCWFPGAHGSFLQIPHLRQKVAFPLIHHTIQLLFKGSKAHWFDSS